MVIDQASAKKERKARTKPDRDFTESVPTRPFVTAGRDCITTSTTGCMITGGICGNKAAGES